MPDVCCVVGCTNRRKKGDNKPFYTIPSKKKPLLRKKWLDAIARKNWKEESINNARICGDHFISGKRSKERGNPDLVPSVFKHSKFSVKAKLSRLERFQRLEAQILLLKQQHRNSQRQKLKLHRSIKIEETKEENCQKRQMHINVPEQDGGSSPCTH